MQEERETPKREENVMEEREGRMEDAMGIILTISFSLSKRLRSRRYICICVCIGSEVLISFSLRFDAEGTMRERGL